MKNLNVALHFRNCNQWSGGAFLGLKDQHSLQHTYCDGQKEQPFSYLAIKFNHRNLLITLMLEDVDFRAGACFQVATI